MEDEVIKMEVVNPQAAGIDVGSRSHWVAVGQLEENVREYGVFNDDLFSLPFNIVLKWCKIIPKFKPKTARKLLGEMMMR